MSNDTESPVVFCINEDVAATSLISLHGGNDGELKQHDIVANI